MPCGPEVGVEMDPRIVTITGHVQRAIFPLKDEEISVGRDASNHIVIDDVSVSRRHCLIQRQGDRYKILDLNSHNGTFVNESPVKERFLEHGDRIKLGGSLLLFILHEAEAGPDQYGVQIEDDSLNTETAVKLHVEEALYLMARDLNALMKISASINSARGLEGLERELLESIFEVAPAQRGAILLLKEKGDDF